MKGGLPTREELTKGEGIRAVGSLWSEWGDMGNYPGSGFVSHYYWTSEQNSVGYHYLVYLSYGYVYSYDDTSSVYVVCRQDL